MSSYTDCSGAIAAIQVWRSVLSHLEPDGNWRNLPLLAGWEQKPYALSPEALTALAGQLEQEYQHANHRFLQRRLAGHRKDSTFGGEGNAQS